MPDDWGGIERYVATLAYAQSELGHRVVVAAPSGSPLAQKCGVTVFPVDLREPGRAFLSYLSHFRSEKYDVVVTHFSPDYRLPAWAARLGQGGPVLLTRHVAEPFKTRRARHYRWLYRGFIGVSHAVGRALAVNLPPDRIRSVHGGCVALSRSTADRIPGPLRVGFLGRLVPQKGVDILIEARRIASEPWSVHVYGSGPEQSRLEELARGLDITFYGKVDDVSEAVARVDITALPSRWAEAFSIAAMESMSAGKPVVASRVGGVPELFAGQNAGRLFEAENVKEMASIIDEYARNPEQVHTDGIVAEKLYHSQYTPHQMAARVTAAYRELIA